MGREVRRVPPNWKHPKQKKCEWDPRLGRLVEVETFQPMHDENFETAMKEWLNELNDFLSTGIYEAMKSQFWTGDFSQPYRSFCDWHGDPPDKEYYRPVWKEQDATWFQVYETVTEGTPVTPPFATAQELVDYLVANGDEWDQKRGEGGWDRKTAEAFVGRGHAFSMMVEHTASGTTIKTPRDGS